MGYPSRSAVVLAAALILSVTAQTDSSAKAPASREEIRDAIARWWDSTDSIDAKFDLTRSDDGPVRVYEENRLVIASGGRYFLHGYLLDRDGQRRLVINQCTDGTKTYRIDPVPGNPDIIDAMEVLNSKCTNDTYSGPMNDLLWLLMPGGKRLHRWLDDGAKLTIDHGDDGSDRYVVEFDYKWKSNPVRCELDPAHDWLPRALDVGKSGDALQIHVTRYKLVGGRFLPSEAEVSQGSSKGAGWSRHFLLRSSTINGDLAAGLFQPKGVVTGTLIMDHQIGDYRIQGGGGRERLAFEARYSPSKTKSTTTKASTEPVEPLRADRMPAEWPVVPILIASAALLLTSILVHRRRGRPAPRTDGPP